MKQTPVMYFQMSQDGNWIVSKDFDGMDIKLEQESGHQDPASLGLRWKKTVRGPRVVGSNHDSTTKQICNNINCEQNEGTTRNIQDDEKVKTMDLTPIYIGGGLAVFILAIGFCLGVVIVRHPHSHISNWLGNFIK